MAEKKNKLQFGIDGGSLAKFKWPLARARISHDVRSDFVVAPHFKAIFARAFEPLEQGI
jgi:hypothetical protein